MKVLTLDLETAPNLAHVWGLWDQNVGLPQLLEAGYVLSVAAKWEHRSNTMFFSTQGGGKEGMVTAAHALLEEADVVVHYNGTSFDLPWLRSEFVKADLLPTSPVHQIDLLRVVKQNFRFPSNKLEYVARELLGDGKSSTGGHATWIGCMNDDPAAWRKLERYNRADVILTERLYHRLKPWIKLPNPVLYGDADPSAQTCAGCGSHNIVKRGLAYTTLSSYQRYQCNECGRWGRGKNRVRGVDVR